MTLSDNLVDADAGAGTVIGTLAAEDRDFGESYAATSFRDPAMTTTIVSPSMEFPARSLPLDSGAVVPVARALYGFPWSLPGRAIDRCQW